MHFNACLAEAYFQVRAGQMVRFSKLEEEDLKFFSQYGSDIKNQVRNVYGRTCRHPCFLCPWSMHKYYKQCNVLNLFCNAFSTEYWINWIELICISQFTNYLDFQSTLLSVAKNVHLNNCSKTTHYAQKYLFYSLSHYSMKILPANPPGCSSFLFT